MLIKECLKMMVDKNGSDLFYRTGGKVSLRLNGSITNLNDSLLSLEDVNKALKEILSAEQMEDFKKNSDIDFALYVPEINHRFRVSVFKQRNTPSLVIRNIPEAIDSMEALHLPVEVLKKLAMENRGLVLLTGTTGSGKSTTISAVIEYINQHCCKHVLTIEEPVEFTFKDKNSLINQRELGRDVSSYPVALRSFTLQSPDVIYIGNIRDYETMSAALTSAETGVLVLSTLHTINASQTIERIINFFPPHQHAQVRSQLSLLLKGIISQRLVPLKNGTGRILAYEVMLLTPTIGRLIREGKVWELPQYIEDGAVYGMQSFRQSLVKLIQTGEISEQDAMQFVDNKDEFQLILKGIKKM